MYLTAPSKRRSGPYGPSVRRNARQSLPERTTTFYAPRTMPITRGCSRGLPELIHALGHDLHPVTPGGKRRLDQPVPRALEQSENLLFCRRATRQEPVTVQVHVTSKEHALLLGELSRCGQNVEPPGDPPELLPSIS